MGLSLVPSISRATQAEAEAGADNTKAMTPLRTAQAIAALGGVTWAPRMMAVTNRVWHIDDGNQSNGVDTTCTARRRHYVTAPCTDVRLLLTNVFNAAAPAPNPYAITIKAALETSDGTIYPLFFAGARSVTLAPGAEIFSDPLPLFLAKGDYIMQRVNVTVASGDKWPRWVQYDNGIDTFEAGVDKTDAGVLSGTNGYFYAGSGFFGRPLDQTSCVAVLGDSIAVGGGAAVNGVGFIQIAFGAFYGKDVAHVCVGASGDTIQNVLNQAYWPYRVTAIRGCTTALVQLGTNDVMQAGRTALQVKGDLASLYGRLAAMGMRRIYQCTITPRTTSTDSWATVANQTTVDVGRETARVEVNAWIRANAAGIAGYFEVADIVESARDSGLWKAGATADGVHPNQATHELMADVIDIAALS